VPPPLAREFYDRPAPEVAPALLGCVLEHETADGLVALELTEVEAYAGPADPASHAYRGKTARNAVMFGPPGHAYVYFTYGMHFCVNVVCQPAGNASGILLRAGRIVTGESLARRRRVPARKPGRPETDDTGRSGASPSGNPAPRPLAFRDLARGPGRLCQALAITREQDGADLCVPASPLRLRGPTGPDRGAPPAISAGPRVGISAATEIPWRFWVTGDPTVSLFRPVKPRPRPTR
jgi:DNA-3-methyladenine glycosylase